jgi:SSS family transporter
MLHALDAAVIALYIVGALGVGYWSSRSIKSADDFSVAGGHLRFPVLLGTLIATAVGASSTMGKAGKAYEVGFGIFFASFAYAAGLYLFSYLAPVLKRIDIWSVPQALRLRYGQAFMYMAGVIILLAVIGIFGVQLVAFGVVVVTLLPGSGMTYEQAVLGATVIMVCYTALGGLLAVAYTDLLQTIIMVVAIGLLLPVLVISDMGGGASAVSALAPPSGDWLGGMTVAFVVSIFLVDVPFSLLDNSLWLRTGASRNVADIRRGVRLTACFFIAWSVVVTALGVFAIGLLPGLESTEAGADAAIPLLVMQYMPPVIKGLCLAALLAVIMSTADTVLLISGTTVSWDLVGSMRPDMDDAAKIRIARITVFAAGAVGAVFALVVRGLFDVLLLAFAVYVASLFVPVMAALFWRRATRAGAFASAGIAFLTLAGLYAMKFAGTLPDTIEPIPVSMALGLVAMVAVSLAGGRHAAATPPLVELNSVSGR